MKTGFISVLFLICFLFLIAPVFSQEPDEESILNGVQNLSLSVPPTGSAQLGSKESMTEYQSWLESCSQQLMSYSNGILMVFGVTNFDWSFGSMTKDSSGTLQPAPALTYMAPPQPTTPPSPKSQFGDSSRLTTIATITGESGHQESKVLVPYGYWELWYSANPLVTGAQDSHSASGTNSAVFASLKMVISESESGEEVETVEPPGGLDKTLWQRAGDPRPWSKKFYQGNKEFTFEITARHVTSYVIEVRVPTSDYISQTVQTPSPTTIVTIPATTASTPQAVYTTASVAQMTDTGRAVAVSNAEGNGY